MEVTALIATTKMRCFLAPSGWRRDVRVIMLRVLASAILNDARNTASPQSRRGLRDPLYGLGDAFHRDQDGGSTLESPPLLCFCNFDQETNPFNSLMGRLYVPPSARIRLSWLRLRVSGQLSEWYCGGDWPGSKGVRVLHPFRLAVHYLGGVISHLKRAVLLGRVQLG